MTDPTFTISRFRAIDKPQGTRAVLTLGELRRMLSHFEVIGDKLAGRLWSPASFADNHRKLLNVESSRTPPTRTRQTIRIGGSSSRTLIA
jgi:hypothetical protein